MNEALHPYSPRALYLVGHHAQWCGAYFQRVLLALRLAQHPDPAIERYRAGLVSALKEEAVLVGGLVVFADTLARAHGLELPDRPRTPDLWEPWMQAIARGFKERLDLSTPASAAFTFGWQHGQVRATLASLVTAWEITRRGVDLRSTLDAGVKDVGATTHRWFASAMLLAQLPGGRAIVDAWKPAFDELRHLSRADVGASDANSLEALALGSKRLLEALAAVEELAMRELSAQVAR